MEPIDPVASIIASIEYTQHRNNEWMRLTYGDQADAVAAQIRGNAKAREERAEAHARNLRLFAERLTDTATGNPVAEAVCKLHELRFDGLLPVCEQCNHYTGDYEEWPCSTITAVVEVFGMEAPTA